jgi:hypothetical protein
VEASHLAQACECGLQDQPLGWALERKRESDGAAEGFAQVEDPRAIHAGLGEQGRTRCTSIVIGAVLARAAAAAPVAPVVEQQNIQPYVAEQRGVEDAVTHVAGVAVAEQEVAQRRRLGRDPPAVKPLPVARLKSDVPKVQASRRRRLLDHSGREVEKRFEKEAAHGVWTVLRDRKPMTGRTAETTMGCGVRPGMPLGLVRRC